jgi:hypothetical protein
MEANQPATAVKSRDMWDIKRIYKELADPRQRHEILTAFWRYAEPQARLLATAQLAKMLHFRDETIRKMPNEKKADLLASRIGAHEFDEALAMGLMQYHTHQQEEMLGAFLDEWKVPHDHGAIESDDYKTPTTDQVRDAVRALDRFGRRDVALYLASAGLLMGDDWRKSTWPVVDEMANQLTAAG